MCDHCDPPGCWVPLCMCAEVTSTHVVHAGCQFAICPLVHIEALHMCYRHSSVHGCHWQACSMTQADVWRWCRKGLTHIIERLEEAKPRSLLPDATHGSVSFSIHRPIACTSRYRPLHFIDMLHPSIYVCIDRPAWQCLPWHWQTSLQQITVTLSEG